MRCPSFEPTAITSLMVSISLYSRYTCLTTPTVHPDLKTTAMLDDCITFQLPLLAVLFTQQDPSARAPCLARSPPSSNSKFGNLHNRTCIHTSPTRNFFVHTTLLAHCLSLGTCLTGNCVAYLVAPPGIVLGALSVQVLYSRKAQGLPPPRCLTLLCYNSAQVFWRSHQILIGSVTE